MAIQPTMLKLSRTLRKEQTPWEKRLWMHLRAGRFHGLKFKRQVVIGSFIADFCCFELKLVIEADGSEHDESSVREKDVDKEKFLRSRGYTILRFWNSEIDENIEGVLKWISDEAEKIGLTSLPTSPLARGEG